MSSEIPNNRNHDVEPKTPENVDNPPGYPPLRIQRRDGRLWLDNGNLLEPTIPIGPEDHHIKVFVEYERSFGRGQAKYITHSSELYDQPNMVELYGEGFGEEYRQLAEDYGAAAYGTPQLAEEYINRVKEYRLKHPRLYEDVDSPPIDPNNLRIRVVK